MMLRRKALLIAIPALAAFGFAPVARADHDSFEYAGPLFRVHGEDRIVEALQHLEVVRRGQDGCGEALHRAMHRSHLALRSLCNIKAKYYVMGAIDHMRRFRNYPVRCDLEDANRLLRKALYAEHCAHGHDYQFGAPAAPPVAPPAPAAPAHPHQTAPAPGGLQPAPLAVPSPTAWRTYPFRRPTLYRPGYRPWNYTNRSAAISIRF